VRAHADQHAHRKGISSVTDSGSGLRKSASSAADSRVFARWPSVPPESALKPLCKAQSNQFNRDEVLQNPETVLEVINSAMPEQADKSHRCCPAPGPTLQDEFAAKLLILATFAGRSVRTFEQIEKLDEGPTCVVCKASIRSSMTFWRSNRWR
jgi:hypothetical protein